MRPSATWRMSRVDPLAGIDPGRGAGEPLEEPGGLDRRIQRLREELAAYEGPSER